MSVSRTKRPAFQWYPGDWRRDTALQACSIEARGLWLEMLNLMHDGEPYGHLTAGGVPIDGKALAHLTGVAQSKVRRLLDELGRRKIFSRTGDGVIFSRRMVRDEALRNERAGYGSMSLENPNVPRRRDPDQAPLKDARKGYREDSSKDHSKDTSKDHSKDTLKDHSKDTSKDHPKDAFGRSPATATALASAIEPAVYAQALTIRANNGLAEHPDRPQPDARLVANNGATRCAADLIAAGVPLAFAEDEVYRIAKSHGAEGPITTLKYFTAAIIRAWRPHQVSNDIRVAGRPKLLPRNGTGDAALLLSGIRRLVQETTAPGQAIVRFIPKRKVEELGVDVLAAYEAVGGADRVLTAAGKDYSFLVRDFDAALRAARSSPYADDTKTGPTDLTA